MATYRVHFTWKEKPRIITATGLDMTHPYFVSITGLQFRERSTVIIDPDGDELRREFGDAFNIMIPFQNVSLIEELNEQASTNRPPSENGKVIPFTVEHPDNE